jgi:hypothetical protein
LLPIIAPATAPAAPPSTAPFWVLGPVPTHPVRTVQRARTRVEAVFLVSMDYILIETF